MERRDFVLIPCRTCFTTTILLGNRTILLGNRPKAASSAKCRSPYDPASESFQRATSATACSPCRQADEPPSIY